MTNIILSILFNKVLLKTEKCCFKIIFIQLRLVTKMKLYKGEVNN